MNDHMIAEDYMESGFTAFPVNLTQNAWVRVADHSNKRLSLYLAPQNPSILVAFGPNAPAITPTLLQNYQYTPNVLTSKDSPAMVRGSVWVWTSVLNNVVLVHEEMRHGL